MKDLAQVRHGVGPSKFAGYDSGFAAPTCGKPPAFRPTLHSSTSSALAGRLSLPASADVHGRNVLRKGEAFPQVRRPSRRPMLKDARLIGTRLRQGTSPRFERKAVSVV